MNLINLFSKHTREESLEQFEQEILAHDGETRKTIQGLIIGIYLGMVIMLVILLTL